MKTLIALKKFLKWQGSEWENYKYKDFWNKYRHDLIRMNEQEIIQLAIKYSN